LVSTIKHKPYIKLIHEIDANEFNIFNWIDKRNKRLEIDKINFDFQTDDLFFTIQSE